MWVLSMPAVVATGTREAVGKDAALEVFAEGWFDIGGRCVMVALPVKLACAGQRDARGGAALGGDGSGRAVEAGRCLP